MSDEITLTLPAELVEQIARRATEIVEQRHAAAPTAQRWLTVDQAAAHIGSNRQRIYDLRSTGRLARNGDGRRGLVDRQELDQLIQQREGRTR